MGTSTSTDRYEFFMLPTAEFAKIDRKLLSPLCKVNLCKISKDHLDTIIAIPKYWSIRSRAAFLTRLPRKYIISERPWGVVTDDNNGPIPDPDPETLAEIDQLPVTNVV